MIGQKFGRLTVIEELPERKHGSRVYRCKCDCGNIINARKDMLKNGNTRSCGCLQREKARDIAKAKSTHGKSKTRLYNIYYHIINRCYRKNEPNYENWGGRGIKVCNEWKDDFMTFHNWAIDNGYREGLSIDRIDNDKGYSPDNCRWTTNKQQSNNRRSNIFLEYEGKTQTIMQWSEELGNKYGTMIARYHAGWPAKEILFGKEKKSEFIKIPQSV